MQQNTQNQHPGNSYPEQQKKANTDPVGQNIQIIADLHKHAERRVSPQQRAIEVVTAFLGRPLFLFLILAFVVLWVLVNVVLAAYHLPNFDPPPFIWLSGILSLGALLQATVILITQNRQDEIGERRTQLDLQVSLLVDQKLSKLIAMVDELGQDISPGEKPHDTQAEAMKESIDPHKTLSSLEQFLEKAEEEAKEEK